MKKIRVVVADHHELFREGLCRILKSQRDIECLAVAQDGEEAVALAKDLLPDIVTMDVAMPKLGGIEAGKQIKLACPATAVLIVTHSIENHDVAACIQAGLDGYLTKEVSCNELVNAIHMVCFGEVVYNLQVVSRTLQTIIPPAVTDRLSPSDLHSRELEVLKLVARGMTNRQIANHLHISGHTVATHLVNIFRKLNVASRTEAVLYALSKEWLELGKLD